MSLEGIWKAFTGEPVLRGLDLEVPPGEHRHRDGRGAARGRLCLLRLTAGLIKPDRGRIRTLGEDITPLREEALLPIRRRMGFVFQGAALFDSLTVYENVAYPLREHAELVGGRRWPSGSTGLLARVGLQDDVDAKLPAELSGGMRKRVGIARALVLAPELVLYDEPTAGLDPTNARLITELVETSKAEGASGDGDGRDPRLRLRAQRLRPDRGPDRGADRPDRSGRGHPPLDPARGPGLHGGEGALSMDASRPGAGTALQLRVGRSSWRACLVFAGLVYVLGRSAGLFERQYRLVASFGQIGGLIQGATVRLAGVPVGRVGEIRPARARQREGAASSF